MMVKGVDNTRYCRQNNASKGVHKPCGDGKGRGQMKGDLVKTKVLFIYNSHFKFPL